MDSLRPIEIDLGEYFEKVKGRGVLATAGADGRVDAAIYARPKIIDEHTVGFIMRDRLSHANVTDNPHAAYLYVEEEGGGYEGIRLFLTRIHEEEDSDRLFELRRSDHNALRESPEERGRLFLVLFRIDRILPLTARSRVAALADVV